MYYTKEQQIERIVLEYCAAASSATLQMVKSTAKLSFDGTTLSDRESKAFATGVMCMMDGMKEHLLSSWKPSRKIQDFLKIITDASRGPARGYGVTKP